MAKNNVDWKPEKPSFYDKTVELKNVVFLVRAFRPGNRMGRHEKYWTGFAICKDKKSGQELFRLTWSSYLSQLPGKTTRRDFGESALALIQAEYKKRCHQYQAA